MGGVGEFKDSVADDFGGGFGTEVGGLIVVGRDDREVVPRCTGSYWCSALFDE